MLKYYRILSTACYICYIIWYSICYVNVICIITILSDYMYDLLSVGVCVWFFVVVSAMFAIKNSKES